MVQWFDVVVEVEDDVVLVVQFEYDVQELVFEVEDEDIVVAVDVAAHLGVFQLQFDIVFAFSVDVLFCIYQCKPIKF